MRRITPFAATAALAALAAAPTLAQKPADLLACVAIARDAERLACYDAAVADTSPQARAAAEARSRESARIAAEEAAVLAAAAKAKAEADAVAAAAAQREAFGGEAVATRKDRFKPPVDEIQEIETKLVEVLTNTSGLGVFLLENGQLWRQVDTASTPNLRPGDAVKLTRAPLGGYHLNFLKQKRRVLVKRVR